MIGKYVLAYGPTRGAYAGYILTEDGYQLTMSDARRVCCPIGPDPLRHLSLHGPGKSTMLSESYHLVSLSDITRVLSCPKQIEQKIMNAPVTML